MVVVVEVVVDVGVVVVVLVEVVVVEVSVVVVEDEVGWGTVQVDEFVFPVKISGSSSSHPTWAQRTTLQKTTVRGVPFTMCVPIETTG